ncbi:flagellar hook-associated protein FlgK [Bacillus massiliglaciei]|uniref:flagellar hook-associated protein FlgK n=1 Tax=Bacillus massiliglaciei TaxID=1816693 RepID=UPI000ABA7403|nr:flagellar hook-associated protein FlgK [Bacillus massiliglaciei]
MISTFMGLETAKRGMNTAQSALYTTGNNVANANTEGYSRQRLNLVQTSAFPTVGMNSPLVAGQLGTGVAGETVQRIRDSFLDTQFRTQNNKIGYYGALSESLTKMEGIMNEPTDNGLQATMSKFWSSLQGLSANAENSGARSVVASTGQMVADTLNYYYNSLTNVQTDIGNQINVKESEINSLIQSIDRINSEISKVEPHGYIPNDLYDERDLLVDNLSKMVNIKVSHVIPTNYGKASDGAAGLYNIELVSEDGSSYQPPVNLVSVNETGRLGTAKAEVQYDQDSGAVSGVKFGNQLVEDISFSGEFAGIIKSYGYMENGEVKGIYPEMIENLNNMTAAFVKEFNYQHAQGHTLADIETETTDFFTMDDTNPAKSIKVNTEILNNSNLIRAGGDSGASGDNKNALKLAELKKLDFTQYQTYNSAEFTAKGLTGSFDSYYSGIIGQMGVDSQSALKDTANATTLASSVENNRQSVSSVSLDEEMTDMIKFQQAYNASARMVTMMDELLDKIINGMGLVGR